MTTPVVHGYPDFARQVAEADVVYLSLTGGTGAGGANYGPFFVGAAANLVWGAIVSTRNCVISATFSDAASGGNNMGRWTIEVNAGSNFLVSIPVMGPYVTLSVGPVGGSADWFIQAASAREDIGGDVGAVWPQVQMAFSSTNINAGATRTDNIVNVTPGEADWFVFSSAATWQANLEVVHADGTVQIVDIMNQTQNPARRRVMLPAVTLRTRITNQTGAAVAFTAGVFAHGPLGTVGI